MMLILINVTSFAQTSTDFISYEISGLLAGGGQKKLTDYLGTDESGGTYFVKENLLWSGGGIFIDHFGKDLTLIKEGEVPLKWGKMTVTLLNVLNIGGKFMLFAYDSDWKADKTTVYQQEIDQNTLMLKGDPTVLITNQLEDGQKIYYSIVTADNNSYIAFMGNMLVKGSENEQYKVTMYDSTMNKVWQKDIKLTYTEKQFATEDWDVDRKGNFYILGKNYLNGVKEVKGGVANYNYRIIAYKENGTKSRDFKIDVSDKFINSILMIPSLDGTRLMCGGFYSTKGTTSIKGVYMMAVDMDNLAIVGSKSKEFDSGLLARLMTTHHEAKTGELTNYDVDDIIRRSDGGFVLTGEQSYVVTNTYTDAQGHMSTTTTYHYNNLILVNISPDLTIDWIKDIPKRQTSSYPITTYALAIANGNLYYIFNQSTNAEKMYATDGKLEDKTLGEEEEQGKHSSKEGYSVVAVKVAPDGTRYSQKLWKTEYGKMAAIDAGYCQQLSDDSMFFYCTLPSKSQIGFFHFK